MQEFEKNKKSLTERAFNGFFWMILGSVIQLILKIGILAVLARLVTPQEFGVMGIALVAVEFSKMFSHMGIGPAIIQRRELEERHLTTGFTISLLMGIFFALILAGIAPVLSSFFQMPQLINVLRIISLVFFIDSLNLIAQALMQRHMKLKLLALLEVISYSIGYGLVGIALAYLGWGIWALVTANLVSSLLHAVLLIALQPFPKKLQLDGEASKELLFFGGGMTLAKVANYLATQGDNLVVGKTLGAAALGIYGRAYQFMVMPASLFGNALDRALFPAMSKVQHDTARLSKAYFTGIGIIALVAIPISAMMVLLAPEIVAVVLGPAWNEVVLPLQILSFSLLFRMSYKLSDSLARATGAVYRRAWRQIIYAGCVLLGAYLGQFFGLYGVATGVALALIINFLLMADLSLKLTSSRWPDFIRAHKQGMVLGTLSGCLAFGIVTCCRAYAMSAILTLMVTSILSILPIALAMKFHARFVISDELNELFTVLILKRFRKTPIKNA